MIAKGDKSRSQSLLKSGLVRISCQAGAGMKLAVRYAISLDAEISSEFSRTARWLSIFLSTTGMLPGRGLSLRPLRPKGTFPLR